MSEEDEQKLGQDDIEALLAQEDEEEEEAAGSPDGSSPVRVEEYDFLDPSRFNRSELEKLKRISSNLAQRAVQPLSRLLQSRVQMQLANCDQTMWQYMVEDFSPSAVGYEFSMVSLDGQGVITMGRPFARGCLELLTGGPGDAADDDLDEDEFTETDARILAHVAECVVEPLPDLWSRLGDFSVEFGGFLSDIDSAAAFAPAEDMFQISLLCEAEFGTGDIAICVPFELIRDLPELMGMGKEGKKGMEEEDQRAVRRKISNVPLELTVELGRALLPARDVLDLGPGDLVVLNSGVNHNLRISVNGHHKMHGRPVLRRGNKAIKIEGDTDNG